MGNPLGYIIAAALLIGVLIGALFLYWYFARSSSARIAAETRLAEEATPAREAERPPHVSPAAEQPNAAEPRDDSPAVDPR